MAVLNERKNNKNSIRILTLRRFASRLVGSCFFFFLPYIFGYAYRTVVNKSRRTKKKT